MANKFGMFLIGGVVGAVAALLAAPRSGAETRAMVADKAGEFAGNAQQWGDSAAAGPDDTVSAADNDGRVAFLASFGWTVNAEPVQTQQIRIPEQSSEVFDRYNELQRSQGYDLTQYAGQTVTRYVYEIQNYEDAAAPVYASVLVSDGQVIGGDVASTEPGGVMHGFAKPA